MWQNIALRGANPVSRLRRMAGLMVNARKAAFGKSVLNRFDEGF